MTTTKRKMTFEQWKRRPVYVAQCKTASLAMSIGESTPMLRLLPAYRTPAVQKARNRVADAARALRAQGKAAQWPTDEVARATPLSAVLATV